MYAVLSVLNLWFVLLGHWFLTLGILHKGSARRPVHAAVLLATAIWAYGAGMSIPFMYSGLVFGCVLLFLFLTVAVRGSVLRNLAAFLLSLQLYFAFQLLYLWLAAPLLAGKIIAVWGRVLFVNDLVNAVPWLLISMVIPLLGPVKQLHQLLADRSVLLHLSAVDLICMGFLSLIAFGGQMHSGTCQAAALLMILALAAVVLSGARTHYQLVLRQNRRMGAYETYLPAVDRQIESIRMRQHEYNNRIQTIRGLAYVCPDYSSLSAALLEKTDLMLQKKDADSLLAINMRLLSGYLIYAVNQMTEKDLEVRCQVRTYQLCTKCPEQDLIELISILVDNAMEAAPKHSTVYLALDSTQNQVHFTISNVGPLLTVEKQALLFSKGWTTKKEKEGHGIGLYKLKQAVKEYGGEVRAHNQDIQGNVYLTFELTV